MAVESHALPAEDTVGKRYLIARNVEPDGAHGVSVGGRKRRAFGRPACAAVYDSAVGLMGRLRRHYVGTGAPAGVGDAERSDPFERFGIKIITLALHVWCGRPFVLCASLVPVKSQPVEIVLDLPGIFGF